MPGLRTAADQLTRRTAKLPGHRAARAAPRDRTADRGVHPVRRALRDGRRGGRHRPPDPGGVAEPASAPGVVATGGLAVGHRAAHHDHRADRSAAHPPRASHRRRASRTSLVSPAREAGYRLLGPRLDYLLHLRPAEWPIMAAHTAARVPAGGRPGRRRTGSRAARGRCSGLLLWVVCLNGGTLALNSAFDRDEGDIAYLKRPPPPPRHLAAFSLGLMGAGQLMALALPARLRRGLRRLLRALGPLFGPPVPAQGGGGRGLADQHVGLRHADALCRLGDDRAPARPTSSTWSCSASVRSSPHCIRSPSSISSRRTRDGATGRSP